MKQSFLTSIFSGKRHKRDRQVLLKSALCSYYGQFSTYSGISTFYTKTRQHSFQPCFKFLKALDKQRRMNYPFNSVVHALTEDSVFDTRHFFIILCGMQSSWHCSGTMGCCLSLKQKSGEKFRFLQYYLRFQTLTPYVPRVININFLPTVSIYNQEKRL